MLQSKHKIDVEEAIYTTTVKRGVEASQSQIVRVLGRQAFTKVRVGTTAVSLGRPQTQKGYAITPLFSTPHAKAMTEIQRVLTDWLKACHGQRFEHDGSAPLKPGSTTLYLAVR